MNTIRISATKARNNFFNLLDQVASSDVQIIIEKDNKEVAIISHKKTKTDLKALLKASKKVHGIFKDDDPTDNPLRKPGAADFLGKWDRPDYDPGKR